MSERVDVDPALQQAIERFLYREARLLDQRRLHEWLDLLTDDVHYGIPTHESVQGDAAEEDEPAFAYMDEDKTSLLLRVKRFDTGMAHVETPPSLTQRLVTNVLVEPTAREDVVRVSSSFVVFLVRHDTHQSHFAGSRDDELRKVNGEWKLARRSVTLVQPLLPRALSIFL
jgi:3-phenylpropionate/cinnamic acid dioxygenase small subunit